MHSKSIDWQVTHTSIAYSAHPRRGERLKHFWSFLELQNKAKHVVTRAASRPWDEVKALFHEFLTFGSWATTSPSSCSIQPAELPVGPWKLRVVWQNLGPRQISSKRVSIRWYSCLLPPSWPNLPSRWPLLHAPCWSLSPSCGTGHATALAQNMHVQQGRGWMLEPPPLSRTLSWS